MHGCPHSPYLVNMILEVFTRAIRQLLKIKMIHSEKEEIKVYLSLDDMIAYISDSKIFHQKALTTDKHKVGCKIN